MAGLGFVGSGQPGLLTCSPRWTLGHPDGHLTVRSAGLWGEAGSGPSAGQGHTGARLCLLARGLSHPLAGSSAESLDGDRHGEPGTP